MNDRYITWTDKRGRLNILDTVPLEYFEPYIPERHEPEPKVMYFADDTHPVTLDCYCGCPKDHWVHRVEAST